MGNCCGGPSSSTPDTHSSGHDNLYPPRRIISPFATATGNIPSIPGSSFSRTGSLRTGDRRTSSGSSKNGYGGLEGSKDSFASRQDSVNATLRRISITAPDATGTDCIDGTVHTRSASLPVEWMKSWQDSLTTTDPVPEEEDLVITIANYLRSEAERARVSTDSGLRIMSLDSERRAQMPGTNYRDLSRHSAPPRSPHREWKEASISKLERHSSGLQRGNTCSMLAKYANDPCEEPGAAAAAPAGRNLGFGSFSSDEGLRCARKSTQLVIRALQGLRTKSGAIIDHLEERNGLADIDDRSYHGLPDPPSSSSKYRREKMLRRRTH